MRQCESCENNKNGKCVEYNTEVDLLDGCSNHIYSDDFYFMFRDKVWKSLDNCDDDRLQELKECEPDLYKDVMEELNSIKNIKWINVRGKL